MKLKKEQIERKIKSIDEKDLPNREKQLQQIEMFKKRYPKLYKKMIRQLERKFPDKEFPK